MGRLALIAFLLLLFPGDPPREKSLARPIANWIWGGRALDTARTPGRVYLFQGMLEHGVSGYRYSRQGLHPHPAGARDLVLVLRASSLDTSAHLAARLIAGRKLWNGHGNTVTGFQIDHDCPTRKLRAYARDLSVLKSRLGPGAFLSITGLTDWARHGSEADLRALAGSVDEVVFQLYAGRDRVKDLGPALDRLEAIGLPYKVGVLSSDTAGLARLSSPTAYPHCRGVVVFPIPGT